MRGFFEVQPGRFGDVRINLDAVFAWIPIEVSGQSEALSLQLQSNLEMNQGASAEPHFGSPFF